MQHTPFKGIERHNQIARDIIGIKKKDQTAVKNKSCYNINVSDSSRKQIRLQHKWVDCTKMLVFIVCEKYAYNNEYQLPKCYQVITYEKFTLSYHLSCKYALMSSAL